MDLYLNESFISELNMHNEFRLIESILKYTPWNYLFKLRKWTILYDMSEICYLKNKP